MRSVVIILSVFILSSFTGKPDHPFKEISQVREGVFMDRAEVANIHYREYLYWLKKNESEAVYKAAMPDTKRKLRYQEPLVNRGKTYLEHAAYNYYPVVGVSYEQAGAYCNWRSDRVNELIAIRKLNKKGKRFYGKKVKYRLPTKAEWELMAKDALSEKERNRDYKKVHDGHFGKDFPVSRYNLARIKPTGEIEQDDITSPVMSFDPTGDKMYNLIGNVAEMVQEKGIAKGGSYQHILEDISIEKDFEYTKAESWLGFRCVMEVIEE